MGEIIGGVLCDKKSVTDGHLLMKGQLACALPNYLFDTLCENFK